MKLTDCDTATAERLRAVYEASFPPEERRDWETITGASADAPGPVLKAIRKDDGEACGLVTFWNFENFTYIEHLAIDESMRGRGTGAEALAAVAALCGKALVLEVEPPEDSNPMALRRIGFYRRNGFEILLKDDSPYPYIQPPYGPGLPEVPLLLMSTAPTLDPSEIERTLHHRVYAK